MQIRCKAEAIETAETHINNTQTSTLAPNKRCYVFLVFLVFLVTLCLGLLWFACLVTAMEEIP